MDEKNEMLVRPGLLVEVEITYADEVEQHRFVIVPDEQTDFAHGFLGEGSPLARAVLDEPVGSLIPYFQDDAHSVRVVCVTATDRKPADDTARRREEIIRQAVEQSDRTNAMIFASSFNGKWGDYDPNAIAAQNKETEDKLSLDRN